MILFRADGNETLGSGHIYRTLSIADALSRKGEYVMFITADNRMEQLINKRGYHTLVLNTDYRDMESELDVLCDFVCNNDITALIVDSYFVTQKYFDVLSRHVKTVYIDDLMEHSYSVNTLINYNIYADNSAYRLAESKDRVRIPNYLLSPRYAPLRSEFANVPAKGIACVASKVLILTGGSDSYHVALSLAKAVSEGDYKDLSFSFVVGMLSSDYEALKEYEKLCPNITVYTNVTDMKSLMQSADIAVSAAGSTQYELCATGVPTINYVLADNQVPGANGFSNKSVMEYAGDIRTEPDLSSSILERIVSLSKDYEKRLQMSRTMQAMVDGLGADRIASYILNREDK